MAPLLLVDLQNCVETFAWAIEACDRWLCSPWVTALQVQGAVVLTLLAIGWLASGLVRRKELRRRRQKVPSNPRLLERKEGWPGVTVILPLKGCKKYSLRNWESQLNQDYEGELEFFFVVDSREDPAFHLASLLAGKHKRSNAQVLVATLARANSQKIHNIQTGIQAANRRHEFVLSVDDDVCLHPSTLRDTILALRADPDAPLATGYPFDIPDPASGVLAYSVLSYHLPLLIAFSLRQSTHFVWGGFMMFRLQDMLTDRYRIMKAWSSGGYSDDLIVAAQCGEHGLSIVCPSFTVFPQWLDGYYSWERYWNYLRRQVYVMDTYNSRLNKRINHSMMLLHSYLSLAFVVPVLTVSARLGLWVLEIVLLPTQKVYVGPGSSMLWVEAFGASSCPGSVASSLAFLLAAAIAGLALRYMTAIILELLNCLSPQAEQADASHFHWGKLWLGFFVNNCLIPVCMLHTRLTSRVVWSGVEYTREGGQVVRVRRISGETHLWTRPDHLAGAQIA